MSEAEWFTQRLAELARNLKGMFRGRVPHPGCGVPETDLIPRTSAPDDIMALRDKMQKRVQLVDQTLLRKQMVGGLSVDPLKWEELQLCKHACMYNLTIYSPYAGCDRGLQEASIQLRHLAASSPLPHLTGDPVYPSEVWPGCRNIFGAVLAIAGGVTGPWYECHGHPILQDHGRCKGGSAGASCTLEGTGLCYWLELRHSATCTTEVSEEDNLEGYRHLMRAEELWLLARRKQSFTNWYTKLLLVYIYIRAP